MIFFQKVCLVHKQENLLRGVYFFHICIEVFASEQKWITGVNDLNIPIDSESKE